MRAWWSHFWISMAVVIYRGKKSWAMYSLYWTRCYFSKTERRLQKNSPSGPQACYKLSIGSIVHRFRLLSWSDFGSKVYKVWAPTRDSSYKVAYSFWLCVCTRCLSICAPSFVAVVWCKWALRVIVFGARNTPQTVFCNCRNLRKYLFFPICIVLLRVSQVHFIYNQKDSSIGMCLFAWTLIRCKKALSHKCWG